MADRREIGLVTAELPSSNGWLPRVRRLADEAAVRRAIRLFHEERKWIDERHLEICRVPALTFREQERAELLQELFADLGVVSNVDEAGNLIAPLVYDEALPFIAVTAHMDTTLSPRRPADVYLDPDGSMKGPGVTDNGAGLAALVALARTLRDGPLVDSPTRNVLLVANTAEEGEGNLLGMKHLVGRSDWAPRIAEYVVLDGASTAHITVEALGSRRFEIVLEGKGGHSWNDYGRANPVHAMARAVALLADIELPRAPRATLTVAMMEGGSGINSIASSARAKVDIRSRSAAGMDQVVQSMEEAVRLAVERENRRSVDRLSGYRIREIGNRPAAARSIDNVMAECLLAVDAHLGVRSRLDCASTDANVPLAAGLPAVAIGAGGRGGDAHMPSEWYHPEGRALGLQRILLTLAALQAHR
jgi:acetylornithine deacetylase/succinyl-diaminopimelate desuccinylase-like protein